MFDEFKPTILFNPTDVKKIINLLKKNNIETKYFWKPMHLQKIKNNFIIEKNMKNTNYLWNKILPLPSSTGLKKEEQSKVIKLIKKLTSFQKKLQRLLLTLQRIILKI